MRQKDREDFISIMSAEGVPLQVSRQLLRAGATLHRLAVAQCNGDYPADGGFGKWATKPCERCELHWAASVLKGSFCPDCRTEDRVKALCAKHGLEAITGGDPRGAVLIIKVPSGRTNDWGSRGIVAG
jgi:hypothetical protein